MGTKEYDSKEWIAMRPDVKFDPTKSGSSEGQFKSWFGDRDVSSTTLISSEPTMPGKGFRDLNPWKGADADRKPLEISDNMHQDSSFSRNRKKKSTIEATLSSQKMKHQKSGLEDPVNLPNSSGKNIYEVRTVIRKLIDQNEKLMLKIKEIKEIKGIKGIREFKEIRHPQGQDRMKTKEKEDVQSLKESNKNLERELSNAQKELNTNAALLWERSYDVRDYLTEVDNLKAQLKNSVSIDDMAEFDIRDKTLLESIQDEKLETLRREKKDLERDVRDLKLEIQRLRGKEGALGAIEY